MNAENILGRVLYVKKDRREFLKGIGLFGGSAVIAAGGLSSVFYFPEKSQIAAEEGKEIFPGWIEKGISQPFIQQEKGHFPWLLQAITNNPVLDEGAQDYIRFLNENLKKGRRLSLAEALSYPIEKMGQRFAKLNKLSISNKTSIELESLRAGLFIFAAGFMTKFSMSDLKNLGADLAGYKDRDDYFFGSKSIGRNVFPKLFEEQRSTRVINGQDRAAHFAQHLLIGFEYIYSNDMDLEEHQAMPWLLKRLIEYKSDGTLTGKARALSELLGLGWEYLSLLELRNWHPIFNGGKEVEEGPFDTQVENDYRANRLGVEAAIAFFGGTNEESRKLVFAQLSKE